MVQEINLYNLCVQTHGCLLLCAVVSNGPLRVTRLGVALWCVRVCVCVCVSIVCVDGVVVAVVEWW